MEGIQVPWFTPTQTQASVWLRKWQVWDARPYVIGRATYYGRYDRVSALPKCLPVTWFAKTRPKFYIK